MEFGMFNPVNALPLEAGELKALAVFATERMVLHLKMFLHLLKWVTVI